MRKSAVPTDAAPAMKPWQTERGGERRRGYEGGTQERAPPKEKHANDEIRRGSRRIPGPIPLVNEIVVRQDGAKEKKRGGEDGVGQPGFLLETHQPLANRG
eukprot:1188053-Pyramimonas_sp.AAC.1